MLKVHISGYLYLENTLCTETLFASHIQAGPASSVGVASNVAKYRVVFNHASIECTYDPPQTDGATR